MDRIDHYGGDVDATPANNFEECRLMCKESPSCKRWTYQYPKEGKCHLKNENVEKVFRSKPQFEICHYCRLGFQNSSNITCADKSKNNFQLCSLANPVYSIQ